MKRMLSVIPAVALIAAIAVLALLVQVPSASAQPAGAPSGTTGMPSGTTSMHHHRKNFRTFLNANPDVAQDLEKDPSKINDSSYLSAHSALQDYLNAHPKFAKHVKARPAAFAKYMKRYSRHHHAHPSSSSSSSTM
ncbi:MAG: hypothetical protein ACREP6_03495 [Candidatus Binataceae bacterium]